MLLRRRIGCAVRCANEARLHATRLQNKVAHHESQWGRALREALAGTVHSIQRGPTANISALERDELVVSACRAVLKAFLPLHDVADSVDQNKLALLRRCRWALLSVATSEARPVLLDAFLGAYMSTSERLYQMRKPTHLAAASAGNQSEDPLAPTPLAAGSLEEGERSLLLEAMEAFSEAKVMRVALRPSHYLPFVSSPAIVQLDDGIVAALVEECCSTMQSGAADVVDELTALKVAAAATLAQCGRPLRGLDMLTSSASFPQVAHRIAQSSTGGWIAALETIEAIESRQPSSVVTHDTPLASLEHRMHLLEAKCASYVAANRASPRPEWYEKVLPAVAEVLDAVVAIGSDAHTVVRLRQMSSELLSHMARMTHASSHWLESLLLYHKWASLPSDTAPPSSSPGSLKASDDDEAFAASVESSSPLGRIMHVMLLAEPPRWEACIQLYDQAIASARNAHPSASNHRLTAEGFRVRALLEADPQYTSRAAEASIAELYRTVTTSSVTNHHTQASLLKSIILVSPRTHRGALNGLVADAFRQMLQRRHSKHHASPMYQRLLEDANVHCALGGAWEASISLISPAIATPEQPHQHHTLNKPAILSRYALCTTVAVCVQQCRAKEAYRVAEALLRSPTLSAKQAALCCSLLMMLNHFPGESTEHCEGDMWKRVAAQLHRPRGVPPASVLREQRDYDTFVEVFSGYFVSSVQHRAKAASDAIGGKTLATQRLVPHGCEIHAANVLRHVMSSLSLPPEQSADVTRLVAMFRKPSESRSGGVTVKWASALSMLSAVATAGHWNTAETPTALMRAGFHQTAVVACL